MKQIKYIIPFVAIGMKNRDEKDRYLYKPIWRSRSEPKGEGILISMVESFWRRRNAWIFCRIPFFIAINGIIIMLGVLAPVNVIAEVSTPTVAISLSPAEQVLLGQLFSPNERDRINAALKLAKYSHPDVVGKLIIVAENDKSEMVKRVALRSLGEIGNYEALEVILNSISSPATAIKIEAMGSAVNFSTPAVGKVLMIEAHSASPLIRQKAVTYLGRIKHNNDKITDIFISKLDDISEGVRVAACRVLGEKALIRSVGGLSKVLLNDRSDVVRKYAAMALGNINAKKSLNALKSTLKDPAPLVRLTAALGLAKLGSRTGLSVAMEGIKSPDARARIIACRVIGMVGDESARILLKEATADFDRRVQRAAEKALKSLKGKMKEE